MDIINDLIVPVFVGSVALVLSTVAVVIFLYVASEVTRRLPVKVYALSQKATNILSSAGLIILFLLILWAVGLKLLDRHYVIIRP